MAPVKVYMEFYSIFNRVAVYCANESLSHTYSILAANEQSCKYDDVNKKSVFPCRFFSCNCLHNIYFRNNL